ncbi:MAG: ester cyclase [Solirubrobacterales bacterium]
MTTETKAGTKAARKKGAKTIAKEYFDALAAKDLERAAAVWKPGGLDRLHGLADLVAPDGVRDYFGAMFRAFPDLELKVLEIVAGGNLAAVRWGATGTFAGPGRFQGLAPTGARVQIEGCDMLRVEDQLIVENNAYLNGAQMGRQLGVLPPNGSVGERAVTGLFNARTAAVDTVRKLRERG